MNMRTFFKKYRDDKRGAVAFTIAVMGVVMVGVIALGVDFARAYAVKSRLSYAIDAAALYGGANMASATVAADMRKIFDANFPNDYLGSSNLNFNAVVDLNGDTVSIAVDAKIPTTLGRALGMDEIGVSTSNTAKRAVTGVELALVLDTTASMRRNGKMTAMKSAAQQLINILYGTESTVQNFWISLVPFVASVNVGSQYTDWLTNYNANDFRPDTWKGCVEARGSGYDQTDAPPSVEPFRPHLYESTRGRYGGNGDNNWRTGAGGSVRDVLHGSIGSVYGPNIGCGYPITPLTASRSVISGAIDNLNWWQIVGGTQTNYGLVWGWRTLSPRWRGVWRGGVSPTLPLDYDEPYMQKVVILLTDGKNEWIRNYGRQPSYHYTAYTRYPADFPGAPSSSGTQRADELDRRLENTCTAMKAQGIILYTITFQVSSIQTEQLMERCASSTDHFFNSPSNFDLLAAFERIGSDLSSLRISQ